MKDWFGDGEHDVDMMIRSGVLTEDQIVGFWLRCPDSPGRDLRYKACAPMFQKEPSTRPHGAKISADLTTAKVAAFDEVLAAYDTAKRPSPFRLAVVDVVRRFRARYPNARSR